MLIQRIVYRANSVCALLVQNLNEGSVQGSERLDWSNPFVQLSGCLLQLKLINKLEISLHKYIKILVYIYFVAK